jgi:hypothetical protein
MEKSEKYILNPAYYIGKDKNRAILCNRESFFENNIHYQNCFSFIHPLNAQFLPFSMVTIAWMRFKEKAFVGKQS